MNFANVTDWTIPQGDVIRVTDSQNRVIWEKQTSPDYTEPFYVENVSNDNEYLKIGKFNSAAPTLTIEYSTDKAIWNTLGTTSTDYLSYLLQPGDKVYLRCNTTSWWGSGAGRDVIYGMSKVGGNIMSLLYGSNFTGNETSFPTNNGYEFYRGIFNGGSSLDKLVNASKLLLPVTTLNAYCYYGLFNGCTSLTTAPELPATTLANSCYGSMFWGCTSLTTAPELPATTLANSCYGSMFYDCTALTTAPELPATTLVQYCYYDMFHGCTSLTSVPALPATTLATYCYGSMFWGCTSLTSAPVLPATTLTNDCYDYMFYSCSSLNEVKCLATTNVSSGNLTSWLGNVSATGTFTKAAGVTWPSGTSGIPEGWTVEEV